MAATTPVPRPCQPLPPPSQRPFMIKRSTAGVLGDDPRHPLLRLAHNGSAALGRRPAVLDLGEGKAQLEANRGVYQQSHSRLLS